MRGRTGRTERRVREEEGRGSDLVDNITLNIKDVGSRFGIYNGGGGVLEALIVAQKHLVLLPADEDVASHHAVVGHGQILHIPLEGVERGAALRDDGNGALNVEDTTGRVAHVADRSNQDGDVLADGGGLGGRDNTN